MDTVPEDIARELGLSKTVYALEIPEAVSVRRALLADGLAYGLMDHAWTRKQDGLHRDLMDGWRAWVAPVCDLPDLPHGYPTNGSSEAIRDTVCEIAARGGGTIHVFKGEYEGYEAYAAAYGVQVVRHDPAWPLADVASMADGDAFFLSQPSAIDGNIWHGFDTFMRDLAELRPGVRVMLDLCYVGCVAAPYRINACHPNVAKIFFSLSKAFGVYYWRIGGVFSRDPMPGLWGNQWFKNLASIAYGAALMDAHPDPRELPSRYRHAQIEAVRAVSMRTARPLLPSDVFLLAHRPPEPGVVDDALDTILRRGRAVRFCLTPEMDRLINGAEGISA